MSWSAFPPSGRALAYVEHVMARAPGTRHISLPSARARGQAPPVHAIPLRQAVAAAAMALPFVLTATSASAEPEPVRFTYQCDAECPGAARFVQEVEAHTAHTRLAVDGELARMFLVAVHREGSKSHGVLRITGVDGSITRREVSGESCAEVVSALAFMTALAIDPGAGAMMPTPTAEVDGGANDASVASGVLPGSPADSLSASVSTADSTRDSPSSPEAVSSVAPKWHWGVGVDGQMLAGFVPEWAPGGGVFVDLAGAGADTLVPSFRVSLLAATTHSSFVSGVGAQLTWLTARAEGCPAHIELASLVATVCLKVDAGFLRSEGTGLANTDGESRPWVVPGALGRLMWPSHGGPWIEGAAGLGVPLERYNFAYQRAGVAGAIEVSRVRSLGAELGLGAGYRLP
jgi:hypothetical protein